MRDWSETGRDWSCVRKDQGSKISRHEEGEEEERHDDHDNDPEDRTPLPENYDGRDGRNPGGGTTVGLVKWHPNTQTKQGWEGLDGWEGWDVCAHERNVVKDRLPRIT